MSGIDAKAIACGQRALLPGAISQHLPKFVFVTISGAHLCRLKFGLFFLALGPTLVLAGELAQASGIGDPAFASVDQTVLDFMNKRHVPGGSVAVVKDGNLVY